MEGRGRSARSAAGACLATRGEETEALATRVKRRGEEVEVIMTRGKRWTRKDALTRGGREEGHLREEDRRQR